MADMALHRASSHFLPKAHIDLKTSRHPRNQSLLLKVIQLGSPGSGAHQLLNLEQVTEPTPASVFASEKWEFRAKVLNICHHKEPSITLEPVTNKPYLQGFLRLFEDKIK